MDNEIVITCEVTICCGTN